MNKSLFKSNTDIGQRENKERTKVKRFRDLKFLFIESSSEGYKQILIDFEIDIDNTERILLPSNQYILKKKMNNVCPLNYIPFNFSDKSDGEEEEELSLL